MSRATSPSDSAAPPTATTAHFAAASASFALLALFLYAPALGAPFYSDDLFYVGNEYIQGLNALKLREILSPSGALVKMTLNYAPAVLLAHSLEWSAFGPHPLGYHVVNVLIHALNSVLLGALLLRSGVPRLAALAGALFFLLHAANVEAVAWVSQLKTNLSLLLVLGALLVHPRRPAAGLLLFTLAILTKALAAFALPVAVLFEWVGRDGSEPGAKKEAPRASRWLWLGAWGAVFVAFAVLEFPIFRYTNQGVPPLHPDVLVRARTVMAIATRYLVMASTSYGVEAFHEVPPAESWLDPWWLASIPALVLLGARTLRSFVARRTEAVYWAWAAISFAPVSQIFPFMYPMADRYLYFILPGLIGGALLAARDAVARRGWLEERPGLLRWGIAAGAVALVLLGAHTHRRAQVWRLPALVDAHAVRRYPNGLLANIVRAKRAAAVGDVDTCVRALRLAMTRGHMPFRDLAWSPQWAPVRGAREFQALLRDLASAWIEMQSTFPLRSQVELSWFAEAHTILGNYEQAQALLEQALAVGGLRDDEVRMDLARVRRLRAEAERGGSSREKPR